MHSFVPSKRKGNVGEKFVDELYKQKGYVTSFLSIKDQKEYGYDIKAEKDNKVLKIEVKTEFYTNNIFFETNVGAKKGWTQKYSSTTNVLIHWYFPLLNELIIYPAKYLSLISFESFPQKTIKDKRTNNAIEVIGYLIPISYIKSLKHSQVLSFN